MHPTNFEWALSALKEGHYVARRGWNGPGQFLFVVHPDESSTTTQPFIAIYTAQAQVVPWLASQGDLFAEDWEINDGRA